MECDILAGEQGPSCKTLEQITDLNKVIHIRFVSCDKEIVPVQDDEASGNEHSHSFTLPAKKKPKVGKKFDSFVPPSYRPSSLPTVSTVMPEVPVEEKAVYPKSLSISQILKLGKLVKPPPGRKVLNLFHFGLQHMAWSDIATAVECQIENEPFAEGSFRSAYRATIITADFSN